MDSDLDTMKPDAARDDALLRGRVSIVYALGSHYLFLPFAALCMSATIVHYEQTLWIVATPLVLQIFATIGASRLRAAYDSRGENDDPKYWARQYVVYSALAGSIWGAGAIIWFVPGSFPAQAYLVLAFLGMTATEFVARGAYRAAYFAHAVTSLFPLVALLIIEGGLYAQLTATLVLFFAGVLYAYAGEVGQLLDESILLRLDNSQLIARLSEEKKAAEAACNSALASEHSKSAFISSISHEIRTPLNAILGMAQLLEHSELGKTQRDHVKVLLEAGRGLKILLDDFIALSQQGEDLVNVTPEGGCDVGQAVRTVSRLLQPNAWEKRLRLSVNVASGLPPAAADPRILRRVLLKLGGNAIKFTERGNIEIAVDAADAPEGGRMLRFRVTDTGPGIPGHLLNAIFEPFSKADNSYARRYNGAGVGLAVAKRLVETMGGSIGVESEPGSGATFWLTIPATEVSPDAEIEAGERIAAPTGLHVLCMTTDTDMRAALENALAPFGNRLVVTDSLSETARQSQRGSFTLIIAQAGEVNALAAMPGQKTPILALAKSSDQHPDGADAVLRWPASPNALHLAIATLTGPGEKSGGDIEDDDGILDAKVFSELEKSLGLKTLIDILQSYMTTAEELTTALSTALETGEWTEAARVAQDIVGAAGGLGLTALTSAARHLAQGARDGREQEILTGAASDVLAQHQRTREALRRLYPDLAA